MDFKDYYKSLEVDKSATPEVIQRAYRKLARKYHPDVNQSPGSEDRFKEISEAYEVLKDPERRKTYDRFGRDFKRSGGTPPGWENGGFGFGGGGGGGGASGFSSFFESLFGGAGGGGGPGGGGFRFDFGGLNMDDLGGAGRQAAGQGGQGRDQEARLVLSLEEAARGGQRELNLGDPMTGVTRNHKVNLPAGVRPGQRIRLPGRGTQGISGAGDLYLKVEVKPHPKFRLEGKNLHTTIRVTPWEAALGTEVPVPTLESPITVRVPGGTSSGRKIRLKGKGFPAPKGIAGDLYAEVEIVVPKSLSDDEKKLFESLAEVSSFRAR